MTVKRISQDSKLDLGVKEPAKAGDQQVVMRNARGQFVPGVSGNPAGRKQGSRNRATLMLQALLEGEGEKVVRKAVEMALAGNETALRLVLERLIPPVKERPISLELPALGKASDVAEAVRRAVEAVAAGQLTPSEAETVLKLLEALRGALINGGTDLQNEEFDRILGAV
jgi:hypothetical protein